LEAARWIAAASARLEAERVPEVGVDSGKRALFIAGALALAFVCVPRTVLAADQGAGRPGITFHDLQSQTEAFIAYFHGISLTPEEELIRNEALSPIPAPCCDSYSAATCCCVCNLARSIWGLSNYLVHEEKYSVAEVRGAVIEWLNFTNPKGYSGSACFNGGCGRPFSRDGCGGMEDGKLVL
jgi:hypothetical protein